MCVPKCNLGTRGQIIATGLCVLVALATGGTWAQVPAPYDPLSFSGPDPSVKFQDVGIKQRLDAQVPLDAAFVDEQGRSVRIEDYLGEKPAVLALVYYECPMLCTLILNGLGAVLDSMKYEMGTDFEVITISIDPGETPELAARKKSAYLEMLHRPGGEEAWHFLTGKEEAIDAVADAVGYGYVYDPETDQYAHAAGIMVLTPQGKVSKYYYGIEYIPRDVEFGLVEASRGRVGNLVDQLVLLCFAYDPATGQYGFYVIGAMRIGAVLVILGLLAFWVLHYLQTRKSGDAPPVLPAEPPGMEQGGAT